MTSSEGRGPSEEERIGAYLENSRVLVTGAGGRSGLNSAADLPFRPERLVLYERAESPLYEIALELRGNFPYVHTFRFWEISGTECSFPKAFELHQPKACSMLRL